MPLPKGFGVLTALMNSTADLCEDFMRRFWQEHARGERDLAGRLYDEYAHNALVLNSIVSDILTDKACRVGDRIRTSDGPMIVASFHNRDTSLVDVVLTEDGLPYTGGWHTGLVADEDQVRVERYENGRRAFHGYIDKVTRRLTQTG